MRKIRLIICSLIILFATLGNLWAATPINTLEKQGLFSYKPNGIAIRGYDTVAYFTQGKPVAGKDQFTTQWNGATWKFSSQENLDLFTQSPEKYAPQYGGYCAYGVAEKNLVKIEPTQWTIYNGKLYLNYNAKLNEEWKKNIPAYVKAADSLFNSLLAAE